MENELAINPHEHFQFFELVSATAMGETQNSVWRIALANSFWKRFRGLMLQASLNDSSGLLLTHCNKVHTAFMRFPIDIIYIDKIGVVVKCVPGLSPWRTNSGGRDAVHCLELAAGSIARHKLKCGDIFNNLHFLQKNVDTDRHLRCTKFQRNERGATMIEFIIVGPILTLLGLGILQYGLLFFAKNNINHAAFMAARAGSVANASLDSVKKAYIKALIPLYGGGRNSEEINQTFIKVSKDVDSNSRIELLNPTRESFDDWSDDALKATVGKGKARVIPNSGQAIRDLKKIGQKSGQNILDANLIKLRITHGYEMKIPFVKGIMQLYLKWLDPKTDLFHTQLIAADRFPVTTHVTVQMHSDAIEPTSPVSSPGVGNNGSPVDTGDPPSGGTENPPQCATVGCTTTPTGNGSNGENPQSCTGVMESVSSDVLFDFNSSTLKTEAKAELDRIIAESKSRDFSSLTIRGYTDQIGSAEANAKLSLDRANTVRDYLRSHGFPPDNGIKTEGKGATDPIVPLSTCPNPNTQQSCLSANRRVTFTWGKA